MKPLCPWTDLRGHWNQGPTLVHFSRSEPTKRNPTRGRTNPHPNTLTQTILADYWTANSLATVKAPRRCQKCGELPLQYKHKFNETLSQTCTSYCTGVVVLAHIVWGIKLSTSVLVPTLIFGIPNTGTPTRNSSTKKMTAHPSWSHSTIKIVLKLLSCLAPFIKRKHSGRGPAKGAT